MNRNPLQEFPRSTGEELSPATAKLWTMLLVFAAMIPAAVILAGCWWFQIPLPGDIVLTAKAGVVALLAIPLAIFLVMVMMALIVTAKRLVIGEDCVQLLSRDRVVVHIPFKSIVEIHITGDKDAGTVVLVLRNRDDPEMLLPSTVKDRYEIQSMIYGKSPADIHNAIHQKFAKFGVNNG